MQLADALELIDNQRIGTNGIQHWADLGCGTGLFTQALASLLPNESVIYAIDRQAQPRNTSPDGHSVRIDFIRADFEVELPTLPKLDGLLMANALHYVADKKRFLERIVPRLSDRALVLIVEYETTRSNPWVPFPITYRQLGDLFSGIGFSTIQKLGERPSAYGQGNMYAALLSRQ
ncbi:class I SAM-dependent methyltransferase [Spirosoma sp.]|uniref:class I SAM-dependent methyltransferase n=1 Tax=Spirosoma sp. TaxID=1899569 RepID=UPI003B3AFF9C